MEGGVYEMAMVGLGVMGQTSLLIWQTGISP